MEGYWNNEDATVRCCRIIQEDGEPRRAVEVRPHEVEISGNRTRSERTMKLGAPIYLDDEDGSGWARVTVGRGSVGWPSREIKIQRVLEYLPDRIEQG